MPQAMDLLITGVDIVTFDDPGTVMLNGAIAVKGNTIAWIGPPPARASLPRQTRSQAKA
jgi:cytosine/adenosine deaminase-related metal-dependent hydrolase